MATYEAHECDGAVISNEGDGNAGKPLPEVAAAR